MGAETAQGWSEGSSHCAFKDLSNYSLQGWCATDILAVACFVLTEGMCEDVEIVK